MNSTYKEILSMCCCPSCHDSYTSYSKPLRCIKSGEYMCSKCLNHLFDKQRTTDSGTFKTLSGAILKMRANVPFSKFKDVFFTADYALLSFIYRENISVQNDAPVSVIEKRVAAESVIKAEIQNLIKGVQTKDIMTHAVTKEAPEKNAGICCFCNKMCNLLNMPKKILCGSKEHCVCEFCLVLHFKYDNELKFVCTQDNCETSIKSITKEEYENSFQVLLARQYAPSDEIYTYNQSVFQEEMKIAAKDIIASNQKLVECFLCCPKCKKIYSATSPPITLSCFHSMCTKCFQEEFNVTTSQVQCPYENQQRLCELKGTSLLDYCRLHENADLLKYAESWIEIENMSIILNPANVNQDEIQKEEKEENEECQICFEKYDDGTHKKLTLHKPQNGLTHVICLACISDIIKKELDKSLDSIKCPSCNEVLKIASSLEESLNLFTK